jgi:hypothetical protein
MAHSPVFYLDPARLDMGSLVVVPYEKHKELLEAADELRAERDAALRERDEAACQLSRYASIEEKAHLKTIDERDAAEEALSQAYYLIKGESPEWSNLWGYKECLEEIDDALRCLRKGCRCQSPKQ